jgi:hypothetical protein
MWFDQSRSARAGFGFNVGAFVQQQLSVTV